MADGGNGNACSHIGQRVTDSGNFADLRTGRLRSVEARIRSARRPSNDDPRRTSWRRCGSIASCWKVGRASMAGAGALRVISGQLTASDLLSALHLPIQTDCWFALGVPMFHVAK